MTRSQPLRYIWLLISSASGIVALVLISAAVGLGRAMAARVLRQPRRKRAAARLHEHLALAGLAAIAAHGLALLGDRWLKPGWRGIAIPFALSYRPAFTGLGIIAGYLAVVLGPTFYVRRRIGTRRWRTLHRATIVVWALSAVHALGAGADGGKLWLRVIVVSPVAPIMYLFVLRLLGTERTPRSSASRGPRPRAPRHDQRDSVSEPEPARS